MVVTVPQGVLFRGWAAGTKMHSVCHGGEPLLAEGPGSARMADAHTVHLRLTEAYFEPATLLAVLRRLLQRPAEATTMSG